MAISRRVVSIAIASTLLGSVPVAAYAASEIKSSITASSAWTYKARTGVAVKDTAGDGMRADADYRRGSTTATIQTVSAKGGKDDVQYTGTSSTKAVMIKACRRNNNPLQGNACDSWRTL